MRRACFLSLIATLLSSSICFAQASDYPNRPIELILPAAAGGTTDTAVRMLADKWRETLGQSVVVVNKPGAGGAIGASAVAKAAPDGYTLLGAFDSITVALPIVNKVDYNFDSFTYLNGFGIGTVFFAVRADSPWKNIKDFVEAARAAEKAGKPLTYASYGFGVITHFTAERLWQLTGTKLQYVTYRSSPESAVALLGGHVDLAVTAGTGGVATNPDIRIIGVAAKNRRPDLPSLPTLLEQGYDVSLDYISGVLAPAGLPEPVKEKLLKAIANTNEKYGEELKRDMLKADLLYANISGAQMRATWEEREKWFRDVAPRLELKR